MSLSVVSLGMLTIDEIVFSDKVDNPKGKDDRFGILGGAGTYAIVGARLLLPQAKARQVGWVIHLGHDFPRDLLIEVCSWGTYAKVIDTPERPTTRARNIYFGELRHFEFLTPKLQIDHDMLDDKLLQSQTFHIIGTPKRCIDVVKGILAKRQEVTEAREDPYFIWEPMEHSCSPQNLPIFMEAMRLVNVFSPNEDEFAKLLGHTLEYGQEIPIEVLSVRSDMLRLDGSLDAIVVRLGPRGAYVAESTRHRHLAAYHTPARIGNRVVDVTGGGNAFLGGYCLGMVKETLSPELTQHESAAVFGTIAASFAIEQVGMPSLTFGLDGTELWNGERVTDRMSDYLADIVSQLA
ncbi:MAG: hypothetical protein Q9163_001231 [Psora crenata]